MANFKTVAVDTNILVTDANQYLEAFSGQADVGTLSLVTQIADPAAPTLTATGTGVLSGAYYYKIVCASGWVGSDGAFYINGFAPGAEVEITGLASQQVQLSAIQLGAAGTVARVIYRTASNGASGSEEFCAFIQDNTTTVFTDNLADASLGTGMPTVNGTAIPAAVPTTNTTGSSLSGLFTLLGGSQATGDFTLTSPQSGAASDSPSLTLQGWNGTAAAPVSLYSDGSLYIKAENGALRFLAGSGVNSIESGNGAWNGIQSLYLTGYNNSGPIPTLTLNATTVDLIGTLAITGNTGITNFPSGGQFAIAQAAASSMSLYTYNSGQTGWVERLRFGANEAQGSGGIVSYETWYQNQQPLVLESLQSGAAANSPYSRLIAWTGSAGIYHDLYEDSSGNLQFSNGGTNIARLDQSGDLTISGLLTAPSAVLTGDVSHGGLQFTNNGSTANFNADSGSVFVLRSTTSTTATNMQVVIQNQQNNDAFIIGDGNTLFDKIATAHNILDDGISGAATFGGALAAPSIPAGGPNLIQNGDFSQYHSTATVFSDGLTSSAAWTTESGSFTYAADLLAPQTMPGLTATGSGTGLAAGTYTVAYTYTNSYGETTDSPTSQITITAGQEVQVGAMVLPYGATGIKYYMSTVAGGSTLGYVTSSNGAVTNLTTVGNATQPPATNTATLGATSGASNSLATAGNINWKPLTASSGGGALPLITQATFTEPASGSPNAVLRLWTDANDYYEAAISFGTGLPTGFSLYKSVGGTVTELQNVAQALTASTTYTITLQLSTGGALTAKLYSGAGTGGTLLQTLTANDTSLAGGFLVGVGGDTGVVISGAVVTAPWADDWYLALQDGDAVALEIGTGPDGDNCLSAVRLAVESGSSYSTIRGPTLSFADDTYSGQAMVLASNLAGSNTPSMTFFVGSWPRPFYVTAGTYGWTRYYGAQPTGTAASGDIGFIICDVNTTGTVKIANLGTQLGPTASAWAPMSPRTYDAPITFNISTPGGVGGFFPVINFPNGVALELEANGALNFALGGQGWLRMVGAGSTTYLESLNGTGTASQNFELAGSTGATLTTATINATTTAMTGAATVAGSTTLLKNFTSTTASNLELSLDGNAGGTGANAQAYVLQRQAQTNLGTNLPKSDLALYAYDGTEFWWPLAFDYTDKITGLGMSSGWAVHTNNNILDNGSGGATFAGSVTLGTIIDGGAATSDSYWYITNGHAGHLAVSGVNTMLEWDASGVTINAGDLISVVPAYWNAISGWPAFPASPSSVQFAMGAPGPANTFSFGTANSGTTAWVERMRFGSDAAQGSSYIYMYEPLTVNAALSATGDGIFDGYLWASEGIATGHTQESPFGTAWILVNDVTSTNLAFRTTLSGTETFNIDVGGTINYVGGQATAGALGVPAVLATSGSVSLTTTSATQVLSFSVPAGAPFVVYGGMFSGGALSVTMYLLNTNDNTNTYFSGGGPQGSGSSTNNSLNGYAVSTAGDIYVNALSGFNDAAGAVTYEVYVSATVASDVMVNATAVRLA